MPESIFHIAQPEIWNSKKDNRFYYSDTLPSIGFIHCCRNDQIDFVLENWFDGWKNLIVLEMDVEKLSSPVKFENLEGGTDLFPHIYGGIDLESIQSIKELKKE